MKVHVVSETPFIIKGNGVHTAFVDHVDLLKKQDDVQIVVNNEGRGDVFHGHTNGLYYFYKGIRYKQRRVYTAHVIPDTMKGSFPVAMWKTMMPAIKWYMKQCYAYADICIAISPRVEEAIIESGAKTKIVRIYNPIPLNKWKRTIENRTIGRKMLGLKDDDFVVLGVGQLQARKGVEDFIDVAEAIPEAKFVWAGGRPFKALTEGIVRINSRIDNAPQNIQFTGMLDLNQMPYIYAAADIMLFPSYQENCPLAPIEGAASGMPVVFRDITEYHSLYESSYLKASTTEGFIKITRNLMIDKSFYNEACSMSEQLIKQFDEVEIRKKLIAVYQKIAVYSNSENRRSDIERFLKDVIYRKYK
ncbi:MAG: glycosyltransferase family 4 protein [Paludibacteraceae bacterium]|nr:glycosyltransferase family 4 protein [Paludibacteraceae bacterium]MBN2787676.1 glycosyltransferase family 4 protein [Paludibacteraceae bacterium]